MKGLNHILGTSINRWDKKKTFNLNTFSSSEVIKHGVPQDLILHPLYFILYKNDTSVIINRYSKPILSADDTGLILAICNLEDFKTDIKIVFEYLNKWLKASRLSLNFDKTYFVQFTNKNSPQIDPDISYASKLICKPHDTKLLGIYVDSTVLVNSYWTNYTQIKCTLLCSEISQVFLCHRQHWRWFTMPIFILSWSME